MNEQYRNARGLLEEGIRETVKHGGFRERWSGGTVITLVDGKAERKGCRSEPVPVLRGGGWEARGYSSGRFCDDSAWG